MNQNKAHRTGTCGAKTRNGTPCKKTAGWGTNHPGTGRCKLHGGASTGPKDLRRNKNAEKHGLFSKHLPEETLSIIQELDEKSPLDMLWENITIQYAAIIRAQKIMEVKSKEELVKELKKRKYTDSGDEEEFEIQFAWDRQERFLNAQSRAMTSLTGMLQKYDELCKSEMATEEQKLRIEKLKKEVVTDSNAEDKLKSYFEALGAAIDGA